MRASMCTIVDLWKTYFVEKRFWSFSPPPQCTHFFNDFSYLRAVGVNLPCHLVIVMGTSRWKPGSGNVQYSHNELQQMIGRAGRPQFDNSAAAGLFSVYSHALMLSNHDGGESK